MGVIVDDAATLLDQNPNLKNDQFVSPLDH